ncbi:MAG TPA: outer membrane protein transport protein [Candidatus Binatia bacterium]|jgi:long-chain fatty acid transport protein
MVKKALLFWLGQFCCTLIFGTALSFAGGFMIPPQTARALSLGNAVTAGVDDPSAVYHNPAALGEVEGNAILVSGTYVGLYNNVENSGRNAVNKHDDNFLASLFANYHIPNSDLTIGIGTYAPFGLATTYERDFTRFAAQRTELRTMYVTPAISWHPMRYLSLGTGFSFVHASGLFSRSLCFNSLACTFAPGTGEATLRLTDTDNTFAYNVGVLIKPVDNWKFGFHYRGRTNLHFDSADVKLGGVLAGTPKIRAEVRPLALPAVFNAGVSWQINDAWGAEFVYEHARWSAFKSFKATFLSGPLRGFNLPQDWKNTTTLRFGSYYALNRNLELRGGIAVEETPIPNRTLNPAIPDADKLTLNAGFGYKWEKFSFDLGYQAVFFKTRRVTNNELEGTPATGIPFNGAPGKDKYETFSNFVAVSVGYKF